MSVLARAQRVFFPFFALDLRLIPCQQPVLFLDLRLCFLLGPGSYLGLGFLGPCLGAPAFFLDPRFFFDSGLLRQRFPCLGFFHGLGFFPRSCPFPGLGLRRFARRSL
jgi:hypothetical protein